MGARPKDSAKWLLLVEWWYNTCVHLAMGITPYVAVYGTLPPRLLSYEKGTTRVQTIERILRSRDQVAKILKEHLKTAQQRMQRQSDLHGTERAFSEEEWVYLRL